MNDSDGNRTRVTAVKGRCLNRLTTEPYFKQFTRDESYNSIYFYSLQAFFEKNLEKIVSNFYCNLSWICAILYEYAAMVELAYGICLESRRAARLRGFKSLSLRYRGRGKIHFARPIVILTADEICRECRKSRSLKAAHFLMRLCTV